MWCLTESLKAFTLPALREIKDSCLLVSLRRMENEAHRKKFSHRWCIVGF